MSWFTEISDSVANALGITSDQAGFLLSCSVLVSVTLCLALVSKKFNLLTFAVPNIALMGFFISIGWMPYWILLVIAVLLASQFGMKIREAVR